MRVPVRVVRETTPDGRAVLWPAICARAGVTLDARGTRALVRFTTADRHGAYIALAGGAFVLRDGNSACEYFEVRRGGAARAPQAWEGCADALPPRIGRWRLRRTADPHADVDSWSVALPASAQITVRGWQAGDRIRTAGAPAGRRVARYFAEAQVPAIDRSGWPVVVMHHEVIWVPGVCRSLAAPSRPGRPDLIWYRCEREFD